MVADTELEIEEEFKAQDFALTMVEDIRGCHEQDFQDY